MSTLTIILWIALTLVGLGVLLSVLYLTIRGVLWCVYLVPWLARMGWAKLTGTTPTGYGSAHIADAVEIEAKGVFNDHSIPLGTFQGRELREPFGGHVALVGPPRSRKSWGLIMPAIEQWSGAIIVNDMRGELFDHTATTRRLKGPVYRVNLTNKESMAVNVLDLIRWGHDEQYGDVQRLAHGLLSPEPGEPWDSWSLEAEPLLVSLILDRKASGEGSLPAVVRWMTEPSRSRGEKLKHLLRSPIPAVQAGARRILDNSDRQAGVVWGRVLSALNVFMDPLIAEHTAHSDVDLTELQDGTRPVSLYLVAPFGDAARLRPLHASLIEMIIGRVSQPRTEPPRQRLLLCLDEAMNLGRMDELERGMSYLQGAQTQVLLVLQNIEQFEQTYPKSSMLASVGTSVWYTPTPNDRRTAEWLSGAMGVSTEARATETRTVSVWGFLQRTTFGEQHHARPLMTPDEVARLDEQVALVLVKGCAPIKARKLGSSPEPAHVRIMTTRQLVGVNAALIVVGLALGWWWLRPTPTPPVASLPQVSAIVPQTPSDAPTPGQGQGTRLFTPPTEPRPGAGRQPTPREWLSRTPHPGWQLAVWQQGTGWAMSGFGYSLFGMPGVSGERFPTYEACERRKAEQLRLMTETLATQFQANTGVSMTDHGWREDMPVMTFAQRTTRTTTLVCAPLTPDT
jgi:type IV secretory pathway TraG/TraD family ATPase VirD4